MSNPYNQRKEPTFGEPTVKNPETVAKVEPNPIENAEKPVEKQKLAFSLSTKQSPGHTFTPVMKRPLENAQTLATLEEQAEQTMLNEKNPHNPSETNKPTQNGGFTFTPIDENRPESDPNLLKPTAPNEPLDHLQNTEQPNIATHTSERVIPTPMADSAKTAVSKVPSKYRRLLIVLLLLLAIILVIIWLKPKSPESVENLQPQGSSLPIEFRPVDEEEAKRAEAEAKALQQAQQAEQVQTVAQNEQTQLSASTNSQGNIAENPVVTPAEQPNVVQPTVAPQPTVEPKTVETQPVIVETAKKPTTSGSVIYQPETTSKTVKSPSNTQLPSKPVVKADPKTVAKVETAKPVVSAKPTTVVKTATPAPVVKAEPAVATKTMTVPKGVSLMQVFRDNHLNISDVNAMSKVNSIVSNLKVGEKVTVRLDKDGRVAEMNIGSGGKFIRQANGSYLYK